MANFHGLIQRYHPVYYVRMRQGKKEERGDTEDNVAFSQHTTNTTAEWKDAVG